MSIYNRIKSIFTTRLYREVSTTRIGSSPLWVSDTQAMNIATVNRCVRLLSESVASMPFIYSLKRDGIFVPCENNISYLFTTQPNEWTNAFDFWRQLVTDILTRGNAYVLPQYSSTDLQLERLILIRPWLVNHDTINDTYSVSDEKVKGTFKEHEVIHLKGMPGADPKTGVSVLTHARQTNRIAVAGNGETLSRFENGGNVRGILSNTKTGSAFTPYAPDQLQEAAEDLGTKIGRDRVAVIPHQASFTQLSLSSSDMQFLQTRKFTVLEICRFFGVHPSFVFEDTSNNYKSAEQAAAAFVSYTLNPLLRNIETEFMRKLIPRDIATRYRMEFDRRGLYACDLDSKMRYVKESIAAGLYTVNEWRREENRPAVKGGDTAFVSANLKPVEQQQQQKNNG